MIKAGPPQQPWRLSVSKDSKCHAICKSYPDVFKRFEQRCYVITINILPEHWCNSIHQKVGSVKFISFWERYSEQDQRMTQNVEAFQSQ